MLMLVSYDVSTEDQAGRRRLRQVAKACQDYGQRVQYSVFECLVDPAQWTALRARLLDIINPEKDSLRFYCEIASKSATENHRNRPPSRTETGRLIASKPATFSS